MQRPRFLQIIGSAVGTGRSLLLLAAFSYPIGMPYAAIAAPAGITVRPNVVSLNVRDTDIYDVVQLMATQANRNIVLDAPTVPHEHLTIRIDNVPFLQALKTLADSDALVVYTAPDRTIFLGRGASFIARFGVPYATQPTSASSSSPLVTAQGNLASDLRTDRYPLQNASANELSGMLSRQFTTNAIIVADPRSNTLFVWAPERLAQAIRVIVQRADEKTYDGLGYKSQTIEVHYQKASDIARMLQTSLSVQKPASLAAIDATNSIVVVGNPDFLASASSLALRMDRPGQQMEFDVRVADITPINVNDNVGVEWGGPDITGTQQSASGSTVTTFANKTIPINAQINLLQTHGNAKILADPRISTLNNLPASLNVGEQIPIVYFDAQTGIQNVQFVQAGVDLTITPTIGPDGVSTVHLQADYSQVLSYENGYPIVGQRKVDWYGRVTPDDSIVISGLFEDTTSETIQKIPLLGDIPILGQFFRNKATTHLRDEVVFIITPHTVPEPHLPVVTSQVPTSQ